jgi:hypothetical protein
MRMYVIVAVAVVLIACLLFLLDRAIKAFREGRRRRIAGIRLAAAAAEAEAVHKQRRAAAHASSAITSVLPAIKPPGEGPRRVA